MTAPSATVKTRATPPHIRQENPQQRGDQQEANLGSPVLLGRIETHEVERDPAGNHCPIGREDQPSDDVYPHPGHRQGKDGRQYAVEPGAEEILA